MKGKRVTFGPIYIKYVENVSNCFEGHNVDLHSIVSDSIKNFHENKDKYDIDRADFMKSTIIPCVNKLVLCKITTLIDIYKFDIDKGAVNDLFQIIEVAFSTHKKINVIQSDKDMIVFYGKNSGEIVTIDKEANILD